MAIRVLFFSDTHLGFDYPLRAGSRPFRRGPDFFSNFQQVLDHASAARPDLVVHGGDLFFRSRVPPLIVDLAYQALFAFADSGVPIVIVPGNHERSALPASLFLNHPNIHVLDRPRTYRFDVGSERLAVSGFPYLRNVRRAFREALAALEPAPDADYRLLCLHHAIEGARVGPAGFEFSNGTDVIARRELPDGYHAVLAGHVHRHQILGEAKPIVYCGSVERTSFAEKDEAKGFCELILERGRRRPRISFQQLPTRPMIEFDGRAAGSGRGNRNAMGSAMGSAMGNATGAAGTLRLIDAFARQSSGWRRDAIVRIRLDRYPDRVLASELARVAGHRMQLGFSIG